MSKERLTSKWQFWVVASVGLLAVALLIGGLLLGWAQEDNGFMTFCEVTRQDEVVYYFTGDEKNSTAGCKNPQVVALNAAASPWKILVGDDGLVDAVKRAADALNSRVGCKLFLVPEGAFDPDIVVSKGAALVGVNDHAGGSTAHRLVEGTWKVDIVMHNLVTTDELHRGVMHELGHAVGLAHDPFKDSLMFKGTSGTAWLTDADRALLSNRYCDAR